MESTQNTKKPCIQCEKECEILPVQLGDMFTLTFLRICSGECMFQMAYDYFYEIGYHKDFRNSLYDKQNAEDKAERDQFIDATTKAYLEDFRKHLEANPKMLSTPAPEGVLKMFSEAPQIPACSAPIRFTRPSKEDKIKWQRRYVEQLREKLNDAELDLAKVENE